jgi:hypothetical protein
MNKDQIIDNLSALLWDDKMIGTRFTLAISEFIWGVTLIVWGAAHNLFQRPTYKYMDMLGNEYGWGVVFLLSSALQMTIVLSNDLHSRFAHYFASVNAVLWVVSIGGCFLSVYPPPSAMSGELALTAAAIWIAIRPAILNRGVRHG